jgi:hypothetical protein
MGRDLKDIIIIDNSPMSFFYHPENAILSKSWFEDKTDRDLYKLINLLKEIKDDNDVRASLKRMNKPECLLTERLLENKRIAEEETAKGLEDERAPFNSPSNQESSTKHFKFVEADEYEEEDSAVSSLKME